MNYEGQRKTRGADTTITTAAAANCLLLPYAPPLSPVVFIEQTVTRLGYLTEEQFKRGVGNKNPIYCDDVITQALYV